nr:unnamed protein product [Trichobilharzia regenti]
MDRFRWKVICLFCLISCTFAVSINTLQPGNGVNSTINETFTNNITSNESYSSYVMFDTTTEMMNHFPYSENHSSIHAGINNSQILYNVSNFTQVNVSGTREINSNRSINDKNFTNTKANELNQTANSSAYYSGHQNHSNESHHPFNKTKIPHHGLKKQHFDSNHPTKLKNKAPQKFKNRKKRDYNPSSEYNSEETDEDKCTTDTEIENVEVDTV